MRRLGNLTELRELKLYVREFRWITEDERKWITEDEGLQ
jgi:hypothetical protein